MAEISLTKPLHLTMNVTDAEDRLPSLELTVTIQSTPFTTSFACETSTWFTCADWDHFSTALARLSLGQQATLRDMSDEFRLTMEHRLDDTYQLTIECHQPAIGRGVTRFSFCALLEADEVADVVEAFKAFPRWWQE